MTYELWNKQFPMRGVMCGGCKATGFKHAWTKEADYKFVEPPERCSACGGSGSAQPLPPPDAARPIPD